MDAQRIEELLRKLNEGLVERKETVAMTLLAVLSGQSVFLYGPPGTAKSMIASRIASVFDDINYFEYLMQRFSTPEEVFGPVSISELRKDNYVRKTEGFLPEADIAFLDEIWKSSPAILNTLLTIVNEHKFRNGTEVRKAPLKALIAASNEFPKENSGLDALYDRFIVRLMVSPVRTKRGFERMVCGSPSKEEFIVDPVTFDEWFRVMNLSQELGVSRDALAVMRAIKRGIAMHNKLSEDRTIYVSDRRWVKSAALLRSAAYICGKKEVTPDECMLLAHCLWSDEEGIAPVRKIVTEAVEAQLNGTASAFSAWKDKFKALDDTITRFLDSRVVPPESMGYTRAPLSGKGLIKVDIDGEQFFVPEIELRDRNTFTVPVKILRTGLTKQRTFNVHSVGEDLYSVECDCKEYLISARKGFPGEDRKPEFRKSLDGAEADLDSIVRSMGEGGGASFSPSPFLSDSDNSFLRSIREGRPGEAESYRRRIDELRGMLDGRRRRRHRLLHQTRGVRGGRRVPGPLRGGFR